MQVRRQAALAANDVKAIWAEQGANAANIQLEQAR